MEEMGEQNVVKVKGGDRYIGTMYAVSASILGYGLGFPIKNVMILVVTVTGKGDNPSYNMVLEAHFCITNLGVEPKIVVFTPKMDGENNGKPYQKWMIWGACPACPLFLETPICGDFLFAAQFDPFFSEWIHDAWILIHFFLWIFDRECWPRSELSCTFKFLGTDSIYHGKSSPCFNSPRKFGRNMNICFFSWFWSNHLYSRKSKVLEMGPESTLQICPLYIFGSI